MFPNIKFVYFVSIYLLWYNSSTHIYSEISYRNCKENEVTNFTISILSTHLTTFAQNIYLSAICVSLSLNIFSWSPNRILLFHYYFFFSLFSFHFLFSSFFFLSGIFFLIFLFFSFIFFLNIYQLVYRLIHCIKCTTTCSNLFLSTHRLYKMYNMFKLISIHLHKTFTEKWF